MKLFAEVIRPIAQIPGAQQLQRRMLNHGRFIFHVHVREGLGLLGAAMVAGAGFIAGRFWEREVS